MDNKIRDSKFELLRIVAIFGVVLHHLVIYGADSCGYHGSYNPSINGIVGPYFNSICAIGVNLFILISGYFGIKKVISPIIRLLIDCFLCGAVCFCIGRIFLGTAHDIGDFIIAINFRSYWFVEHYILLIILSPIIERSLKGVERNTLSMFVVLISIINVGYGFFIGGLDNQVGYDVINFVNVYFLGRWVRILNSTGHIPFGKWAIALWLVVVSLMGSGFLLIHKMGHPWIGLKYWAYNSPWMIVAALLLFIYFNQLTIQSKKINLISKSVFGIYLLQTSPLIGGRLYDFAHEIYLKCGYIGIFILAAFVFVVCGLFAYPLAIIREKVMGISFLPIRKM